MPNTRYTHCSGDDSSPCNVTNTTRWDKTEPPIDMSFRASAASRGIYSSSKLYHAQVIIATWVDSSTPLRSGRNDISEGGFVYLHGLHSERSGTAHRPFPTVSLIGECFQPVYSVDGRYGVVCYRNNRRRGRHTESHCRERPMCRSGDVANITCADEWYCPIYGIPTVAAMIHRHAT